MEEHEFRRLLQVAEKYSPELAEDIAGLGRVSLERRNEGGLATFLARTVVQQSITSETAQAIWRKLEKSASVHKAEIPDFFSIAGKDAMRECGLSKTKQKSLIEISERHQLGEFDDAVFDALDVLEKRRRLLSIFGVGGWTADIALIYFFGERDVWPTGDLTLNKMLSSYFPEAAEDQRVEFMSPYRSIFANYMWRLHDGKT